LTEVKRAQELDPLSPIVNSDLGWYLFYAGQTADAVAQFRKTIEFDSNSVSAHRGLGVTLSQMGRSDEAIDELKRALDLSEHSPVLLGRLGAAYARAGRKADAEAVLKELDSLATRLYVPSSSIATIYAALATNRARSTGCRRRTTSTIFDRADRRGALVRDAARRAEIQSTLDAAETASTEPVEPAGCEPGY
jgi:tetratricopeptide (TPR) repeat protein